MDFFATVIQLRRSDSDKSSSDKRVRTVSRFALVLFSALAFSLIQFSTTVSIASMQEQPAAVSMQEQPGNLNSAADNATVQIAGDVLAAPDIIAAADAQRVDPEPRGDFPPQMDVVHFRSGGQLLGYVNEIPNEPRKSWLVKTEFGSTIKIDSRTVRKVAYADDGYKNVIQSMDPASPDDHWKVYDWCVAQDSGKSKFKKEIQFHLQRIAALDVNDDKARRLLDLDYDDASGWFRPEQQFATHGYVKVTGGHVPELYLGISEYEELTDQTIADRRIAFNKWLNDVPIKNRNLLTEELFAIVDGPAIPLVYDEAKKENDNDLRMLYVNSIGRVPTPVAANALVHFAVRDPWIAIRERALILLMQDQYNRDSSALAAAHFLTDQNNDYVRQAGFVIAELGSKAAILPLIDALVTIHKPPARLQDQPGRLNMSMDSQGGTGLSTGGTPAGPSPFENGTVLDALRRITGENKSYNEAAWKKWYTDTQTISRIDVRRDE